MPDSWIGLSRGRLRLALGSFFLALAIPTGVLLQQTDRQLQWESFFQHRILAEELATRIDSRLHQLVVTEEARPAADYAFLVPGGKPAANFVVRSPLSAYPVHPTIPGLIGYFQIDENGMLTTPLLPPSQSDPSQYGIRPAEWKARLQLQSRVRDILNRGQALGRPKPRRILPSTIVSLHTAPPVRIPGIDGAQQQQFESIGDPTGGTLESSHGAEGWPSIPQRSLGPSTRADRRRMGTAPWRGDGSPLSERSGLASDQAAGPGSIAPMEFNRIETGHLMLSRTVWRNGHRTIQGALIDPKRFLTAVVASDFRQTAVSRMSALSVNYRGNTTLLEVRGPQRRGALTSTTSWRGEVLYRTLISPPLNAIELVFTIDELPAGPGAVIVGWLGALLALVLIGGCWLLYRLGLRQIAAAEQQQNFVAAVSHELKTPLTSIRMYGEMLREGWVPEARRGNCYDFICTEAERLTRLITNVLELARLNRGGTHLELQPVRAARLIEGVRPRIATQIQQAGFALHVWCDEAAGDTVIRADEDCFAQIAINLVDNAIKFSTDAADRRVELCCYRPRKQTLVISVRDFGPGIPKDRMGKIFRLFYRGENERVRETVGTGIGLALVNQLATAMEARVDVVNREPGAEFRIWFTPCDQKSGSERTDTSSKRR